MTEDEAKTKWCPFVRNDYALTGGNRYKEAPHKVAPCIGSACMAWRWRDLAGEWDRRENKIEQANGRQCEPPPSFPKVGYCGLAGRP